MTSSDAAGDDSPGSVRLSWAHQPEDPGPVAAHWRRRVLDLVVARCGVGIGTSRGLCL